MQLKPGDERLWSMLAEAQLRSGQINAAVVSLARAKELSPNKAELWFAEASLALHTNHPETAVDLLGQGLKLDPDNAYAYFDLGNARIMKGQLRLALKAFEKATVIEPSFWEALNNQALVLFEMGSHSEAIRRWRCALEINASPEAMLALAAALNSRQPGDREAIDLAVSALATDPNYVLTSYQKSHLWGLQLRWATERLLWEPMLRASVSSAEDTTDPDGG
ncbi:tetratricopeptide repeat protein [cyanobiont of Ornithocercus magnificus]|nr:tetratricopeptide repeat protein [cyanobiont of Ornithocercus magnificus]